MRLEEGSITEAGGMGRRERERRWTAHTTCEHTDSSKPHAAAKPAESAPA